jgi:hypothetical protein
MDIRIHNPGMARVKRQAYLAIVLPVIEGHVAAEEEEEVGGVLRVRRSSRSPLRKIRAGAADNVVCILGGQ